MDNRHKILLAVGITAIVTDLIPTPADYFVFEAQQRNNERKEKGLETPKQYWWNEAGYYYLYNPIYYAGVLGLTMLLGKDFDTKVYIALGALSAGSLFYVIAKNIKSDEKLKIAGKIN